MIIEENSKKEPILEISGVTIAYSGRIALADVSFAVYPGEFVGIIGPNGSGKSTLLKGILSINQILNGNISINGVDCHGKKVRRQIGYVAQTNQAETEFPVNAREVVVMGLYAQMGWFKRPKAEHWQRVLHSLEMVGMADFAEHPFWKLSGGQQQRVLIARALVANPQLLFLDEPTSAVDISAQYEILELLERLNREEKMTVLMVGHDINEIVHVCDKIALLDKRLCAYGTPNEVLSKENLTQVYGNRVFVYDHNGHPHVLVGDFHA